MSIFADKRGISPVVATVILVAATIVVTVAVSFWITGITALYTRYEKVEIVSAYAEVNDDGWVINLMLKNTGSADATIDNILINGKSYKQYNPQIQVRNSNNNPPPYPIKVGQSMEIMIEIPKDDDQNWPFVSGVSVEVRLHSAGGQEYLKAMVIP
jgi:flagellin-like protein